MQTTHVHPNGTVKKSYPIKAENDASRECWVELCRLHGSDALMTGWLTKQGHIVPTWKRRYSNNPQMHIVSNYGMHNDIITVGP